MTPDQVFQALVPGVQTFFNNRGYGSVLKLAGNKLRVTVQKPGQTQVTKEFICPADNQELTTQLEAWYEELEGAAE